MINDEEKFMKLVYMIINYYIRLFDIISNNIDIDDLKQIEYIQEMICTYKK